MALSEEAKEELRTQVRKLVLSVRVQYLQTTGANMLQHWDILSNRLRAACRTSGNVEEMTTKFLRDLQVSSPDNWTSSAIRRLLEAQRATGARAVEVLDLVDREVAVIFADARCEAQERKERREQRAAGLQVTPQDGPIVDESEVF